jgi:hypothetical protein
MFKDKLEELKQATQKMKNTEYLRIRSQRESIDSLETRISNMETKVATAINRLNTEIANQKAHREKAGLLLARIEDYLKEWT